MTYHPDLDDAVVERAVAGAVSGAGGGLVGGGGGAVGDFFEVADDFGGSGSGSAAISLLVNHVYGQIVTVFLHFSDEVTVWDATSGKREFCFRTGRAITSAIFDESGRRLLCGVQGGGFERTSGAASFRNTGGVGLWNFSSGVLLRGFDTSPSQFGFGSMRSAGGSAVGPLRDDVQSTNPEGVAASGRAVGAIFATPGSTAGRPGEVRELLTVTEGAFCFLVGIVVYLREHHEPGSRGDIHGKFRRAVVAWDARREMGHDHCQQLVRPQLTLPHDAMPSEVVSLARAGGPGPFSLCTGHACGSIVLWRVGSGGHAHNLVRSAFLPDPILLSSGGVAGRGQEDRRRDGEKTRFAVQQCAFFTMSLIVLLFRSGAIQVHSLEDVNGRSLSTVPAFLCSLHREFCDGRNVSFRGRDGSKASSEASGHSLSSSNGINSNCVRATCICVFEKGSEHILLVGDGEGFLRFFDVGLLLDEFRLRQRGRRRMSFSANPPALEEYRVRGESFVRLHADAVTSVAVALVDGRRIVATSGLDRRCSVALWHVAGGGGTPGEQDVHFVGVLTGAGDPSAVSRRSWDLVKKRGFLSERVSSASLLGVEFDQLGADGTRKQCLQHVRIVTKRGSEKQRSQKQRRGGGSEAMYLPGIFKRLAVENFAKGLEACEQDSVLHEKFARRAGVEKVRKGE